MANRKMFLLGILVMVLVFGMTVVGCDFDTTDIVNKDDLIIKIINNYTFPITHVRIPGLDYDQAINILPGETGKIISDKKITGSGPIDIYASGLPYNNSNSEPPSPYGDFQRISPQYQHGYTLTLNIDASGKITVISFLKN